MTRTSVGVEQLGKSACAAGTARYAARGRPAARVGRAAGWPPLVARHADEDYWDSIARQPKSRLVFAANRCSRHTDRPTSLIQASSSRLGPPWRWIVPGSAIPRVGS